MLMKTLAGVLALHLALPAWAGEGALVDATLATPRVSSGPAVAPPVAEPLPIPVGLAAPPAGSLASAEAFSPEEEASLSARNEKPGPEVAGGAWSNQTLTYVVIALAAAVFVLIVK